MKTKCEKLNESNNPKTLKTKVSKAASLTTQAKVKLIC